MLSSSILVSLLAIILGIFLTAPEDCDRMQSFLVNGTTTVNQLTFDGKVAPMTIINMTPIFAPCGTDWTILRETLTVTDGDQIQTCDEPLLTSMGSTPKTTGFVTPTLLVPPLSEPTVTPGAMLTLPVPPLSELVTTPDTTPTLPVPPLSEPTTTPDTTPTLPVPPLSSIPTTLTVMIDCSPLTITRVIFSSTTITITSTTTTPDTTPTLPVPPLSEPATTPYTTPTLPVSPLSEPATTPDTTPTLHVLPLSEPTAPDVTPALSVPTLSSIPTKVTVTIDCSPLTITKVIFSSITIIETATITSTTTASDTTPTLPVPSLSEPTATAPTLPVPTLPVPSLSEPTTTAPTLPVPTLPVPPLSEPTTTLDAPPMLPVPKDCDRMQSFLANGTTTVNQFTSDGKVAPLTIINMTPIFAPCGTDWTTMRESLTVIATDCDQIQTRDEPLLTSMGSTPETTTPTFPVPEDCDRMQFFLANGTTTVYQLTSNGKVAPLSVINKTPIFAPCGTDWTIMRETLTVIDMDRDQIQTCDEPLLTSMGGTPKTTCFVTPTLPVPPLFEATVTPGSTPTLPLPPLSEFFTTPDTTPTLPVPPFSEPATTPDVTPTVPVPTLSPCIPTTVSVTIDCLLPTTSQFSSTGNNAFICTYQTDTTPTLPVPPLSEPTTPDVTPTFSVPTFSPCIPTTVTVTPIDCSPPTITQVIFSNTANNVFICTYQTISSPGWLSVAEVA